MAARRPRRAVVVSGAGSEDRLALPVELYTRDASGGLVPVDLGSGGDVVVAWVDVTGKPDEFPPEAHTHTAAQVTGLATVATSGSYSDLSATPSIPSTPGDVGAAPASHTHTAAQVSDASAVGRSVLTAADVAAARTSIGAGTSSLVVGTTASTAAAGNHTHAGLLAGSAAAVSDSAAEDIAGLVADFNALLAALRARGIIA